jgi:acetoin:2,6-dichlorophenolindophenol oxidoreductase subunit alpha
MQAAEQLDPDGPAPVDIWALYTEMKRSRLFEEAVERLWRDGLISGEMHLGTGEEAVIAGVVTQLRPDDALAVDHRGTAAFLMRGVDPVALLREMLGRSDGLCRGQGGHMHLFSKQHLAASSGIVGAEGPAAAGFALAVQFLRPGAVAVAFFGDGALNQGMLMESMNLAAVWSLPVLFVCKDDGWAITTKPDVSTAGTVADRARGLGLEYVAVDGLEVEAVAHAARPAIERARAGKGPTLLHARCIHLEGHFLGLTLLRAVRDPLRELPPIVGPLARSFLRRGGGKAGERTAGVRAVVGSLADTLRDPRRKAANDPVLRARAAAARGDAAGDVGNGAGQADRTPAAAEQRLRELDAQLEAEVATTVAAALAEPADGQAAQRPAGGPGVAQQPQTAPGAAGGPRP